MWFSPNSTEVVNSFHSRAEKNLPKQKTRPKRSNYTWGGGGRGEEEKKTSITEPDPAGRRMEEAGSSLQTPSLGCSPHPQLGNIDLYRAPEPWAMWKTFCASAIELIPLEELKFLSSLLTTKAAQPCGNFSPKRRVTWAQLRERVRHTCCWHRYRNPQSTWKAKKKISCIADMNKSPSINSPSNLVAIQALFLGADRTKVSR